MSLCVPLHDTVQVQEYFQYNYAGAPFELFGPAHLWTVAMVALASSVYLKVGRAEHIDRRAHMRTAVGWSLLVIELFSQWWWWVNGAWDVTYMLPLHMCGVMTWVGGIAFIGGYRRAYTLIYFLGIGGALQAIITPDAGPFGYPHFRFFEAIISHALLVLAGLWVVIVEGVRPSFRSMVQTFLALNAYALVIYFFNAAVGSNYLYVNGKPDVASAMDFMPDWPWYIPILEVLAFSLFFLMWLPYRSSREHRIPPVGDTSA